MRVTYGLDDSGVGNWVLQVYVLLTVLAVCIQFLTLYTGATTGI